MSSVAATACPTTNPSQLIPATITVKAPGVTATDNGAGVISGTGVTSGLVNYATCAMSVTFTAAPTNGAALTTFYGVSQTGAGAAPANPGGKWLSSKPTQRGLTTNYNGQAWTRQWYAPKSLGLRIVYNFGKPGWRCGDVPGYPYTSYTTVTSLLDAPDQFKKLAYASSQELVAVIAIGTNDFNELLTAGTGNFAQGAGSPLLRYSVQQPNARHAEPGFSVRHADGHVTTRALPPASNSSG